MRRPARLMPALVGVLLFILFLLFQAWGIYTGDSGDLVTAGYLFGVPHPPGYPLYTFLLWLVSRLPVATVAFRAALLSSLAHAATGALLYALVHRMTRRWWPATLAVLTLAGNYVFFLYSVTPEVFGLFDLFVVGIAFLVWEWLTHHRATTLVWLAFVCGLSLSHHHLVLFCFPPLAAVLWSNRKKITGNPWRYVGWFLLGLLPYLYVPIAARTDAIVNWNRATDISGFMRLVTRADYGTFRSGAIFGEHLAERFIQVTTYLRFILLDFGWAGALLAGLGLWAVWRRLRSFAIFVGGSLLLVGPAYFFYASFPLVNRFMLGTYERFLLPSYVLLSLLAGFGAFTLVTTIRHQLFGAGIAILVFLSPVVFFGMTLFRFGGLPQDRTAEHLAIDVLASIPAQESMLLLSRDTTLFATQYTRYVLGVRSDVPVLAFNHLGDTRYRQLISENFPQLVMPQLTEGFFEAFVTQNAAQRRIFTNTEIPLPTGWELVPHGLLYEAVESSAEPDAETLNATNAALWATYHDPGKGILERYNHLMLSDVRDVYAGAQIALGKRYVQEDKIAWAREAFARAVSYGGDIMQADALTYLGLSELWLGNCEIALQAFSDARIQSYVPQPALTLYESVTYKDCVGDAAHAQALFEQYEGERSSGEILLETL